MSKNKANTMIGRTYTHITVSHFFVFYGHLLCVFNDMQTTEFDYQICKFTHMVQCNLHIGDGCLGGLSIKMHEHRPPAVRMYLFMWS